MTYNIAIVGEAWGEHEETARSPFVGPSGYLLTQILNDAGIERSRCLLTNVFNLRPMGNEIDTLCGTRKDDVCSDLPPLKPGRFLLRRYRPELDRLFDELLAEPLNVVIACGNTSAWALLGQTGITKIRGTIFQWRGRKVIPTFHPAAILREYSNRHVTVLDFKKARRESEFPDIRRTLRHVILEPTISAIALWTEAHARHAKLLSVDIETSGDQITCIGFAASVDRAIVIPFFDLRRPGNNYWSDRTEELQAWNLVRAILALPCPKLFQNGMYDMAFLWRQYGLPTANALEDTMLMHHAMQPESPKALAFLGSVYCDEIAWKTMRPRGKHTIKREE